MTNTLKYIILTVLFIGSLVGVASWASNQTATKFRVQEAISQIEIARLDSIVFSERAIMAETVRFLQQTAAQISLLTVETLALEEKARKYDALAEAAEFEVTYDEPDSILVETINETIEEPNDFVVLCEDDYGFTKFCLTRSLAEDYLTMKLLIPALRISRDTWRVSAEINAVLIETYAEQVELQRRQNSSLININVALTGKSSEFEHLYGVANRAYKHERFLRKATVGAVAAGVLVLLLK